MDDVVRDHQNDDPFALMHCNLDLLALYLNSWLMARDADQACHLVDLCSCHQVALYPMGFSVSCFDCPNQVVVLAFPFLAKVIALQVQSKDALGVEVVHALVDVDIALNVMDCQYLVTNRPFREMHALDRCSLVEDDSLDMHVLAASSFTNSRDACAYLFEDWKTMVHYFPFSNASCLDCYKVVDTLDDRNS